MIGSHSIDRNAVKRSQLTIEENSKKRSMPFSVPASRFSTFKLEIPQSLGEESMVKAWSRPTRRHPSGQHGAQSIDGSIIGGELEFVAEE